MLRRGVLVAISAALLVPAVAARAANTGSPPAPRPFVVPLSSLPLYGVNPTTDKHYLTAPDGTKLFVETWLPAIKNGNVPPAKIPTILVITPYVQQGTLESASTRDAMVTRGYAYSQLHVRGTGMSTGCIQMYGQTEADDGALAIEWVAGQKPGGAPWGNGVVGGYGISYPGGTILDAAARGNADKTQYLKAVVAGAPAVSLYESAWTFDGVESMLIPQLYYGQYMTTTSLPPGTENGQPAQYAEQYSQKPQCYPSHIQAGLDHSGDFTPYFQDRELRGSVGNIRAAVFTFHGHADTVPYHGVPPIVQIGLFDRLPSTTPKFGLFGEFGHETPSTNARGPAVYQRRADFMNMEIAWFDHYLKGIDGGVSTWGTAQVQGTDSKWRTVANWPRGTGGPTDKLALAGGVLGAHPNQLGGSTTYTEAGFETTKGTVPGTTATFDTGPLKEPLELTGAPQLDLWLKLQLPDSHVAARLDAFDAAGNPIVTGSTYALRSAEFREPFTDGRFTQAQGTFAPTGVPLELTLRFQPTDIVVPAGGHLRLTIAGSLIVNQGLSQIDDLPVRVDEPLFLGPSEPSGVVQQVTILTDKQHQSFLQFETPRRNPDYIAPPLVPR